MKSPNFEKFASEANEFIYELAEHLEHPGKEKEVLRILRAVLHTLRDHITIAQSFHLLAQLPMFLKALYVEEWKYSEKPEKLNTIWRFKEKVKEYQSREGELKFECDMPTQEIIRRVLISLKKYVSEGELEDIASELPAELKALVEPEPQRK